MRLRRQNARPDNRPSCTAEQAGVGRASFFEISRSEIARLRSMSAARPADPSTLDGLLEGAVLGREEARNHLCVARCAIQFALDHNPPPAVREALAGALADTEPDE